METTLVINVVLFRFPYGSHVSSQKGCGTTTKTYDKNAGSLFPTSFNTEARIIILILIFQRMSLLPEHIYILVRIWRQCIIFITGFRFKVFFFGIFIVHNHRELQQFPIKLSLY